MKLTKYMIAVLLCYSTSTMALETDEQQNVTIASESAEINRLDGIAIYKDNVIIDRGTTHVTGDKVTTRNDENNKLHEAIIESFHNHLSEYRTLTEVDKPELHAQAKTIKFYPSKNHIVFLGEAKITQGSDSIEGDILEYDILKQRLIAKNTSEDNGHKHRTVIVIAPDGDSSFIQPPKSGKPS